MGYLCVLLAVITAVLVDFSCTFPQGSYDGRRPVLKGRYSRSAMENILTENAQTLKDTKRIFLEGDIYMGPNAAYNAIREPKRLWQNGVVPYKIDDAITGEKLEVIKDTFRHYHERTCIKFVEHTTEEDYVIFKNDSGCWSHVGRTGGGQELSIGDGCETLGTVIHEIMHALGFEHEQSRTDRDKYVTIKWENIDDANEYNFDKYDHAYIDPLGAPYDYKSVMHYFSTAFSENGENTIVPKQADVGLIDRDYFSKWDLFKINKLYNCGMTGLEDKLLPGSGECYEDKIAEDYRGTVSTTINGHTCQKWSSQSPQGHMYTESEYGTEGLLELGLGDHNYCRNPDNDNTAWCHTTNPRVYFDYCDIGAPGENCAVTSPVTPFPTVTAAPPAKPSECYHKSDGSDYRGVVSITENGDTCMVWSEVGYGFELSFEGNSNHNYCRNDDGDNKPWCFTDTDDVGYGFCNVGRPFQNC